MSGERLSDAERAAAGLGPAPQPWTTGIVDIHHDDGGYDLDAAVKGGLVALIVKATEGKDFVDRGFEPGMVAAAKAGVLRGAYHFGSASAPGATQADFFLRTLDLTHRPDVLPALDLEHNPGSAGTMTTTEAANFVRRVWDRTGRWPLLYMGLSNARARMAAASMADRAILVQCPLWLAAYGPDPRRLAAPAPWSAWILHQYTDGPYGPSDTTTFPRHTPGFAREVQDRSCFRGSLDDLRRRWATAGRP